MLELYGYWSDYQNANVMSNFGQHILI